jgi:hypothetical protein
VAERGLTPGLVGLADAKSEYEAAMSDSGDTMPIYYLTSAWRSKSRASKLVGVGLGVGDFAKGQNVRLALVTELNAVSAATLFDTSHRCGSNVTATLLPVCYHGGQLGTLGFAVNI